jgi:glyoxylase-like metal-dependent hydrolase (beta-lactamase superfamily II)
LIYLSQGANLIKIGNYELIPVETGRFALDGGAMFGVVPKNLWSKIFPADEENCISLALRSLILRSNERIILVDTGIGHKFNEKYAHIFKIDFTTYSLQRSLQVNQIKNDEVTDVILTHLHFDHAGGTTFINGSQLHLTFPNAIHHVQGEHWDWALQPSEKDQASFLKNDFALLAQKKRLNKLSGPCELFPGLELLVMHGHTPGMQIVKISDQKQTIVFCADLIPTAAHIPLPWVMAYDNHPLTTMREKKKLLSIAEKEDWILIFEHDPFLIAATVKQTEKGFAKNDVILSLIRQ